MIMITPVWRKMTIPIAATPEAAVTIMARKDKTRKAVTQKKVAAVTVVGEAMMTTTGLLSTDMNNHGPVRIPSRPGLSPCQAVEGSDAMIGSSRSRNETNVVNGTYVISKCIISLRSDCAPDLSLPV
jgi:hypothetical protein